MEDRRPKQRISIRLDEDLIEVLKQKAPGGRYQTYIQILLRKALEQDKFLEQLEKIVRKVKS